MSGAFELDSITPTDIGLSTPVTAGGIFGSNIGPPRSFLEANAGLLLGAAAVALVALAVLRRGPR